MQSLYAFSFPFLSFPLPSLPKATSVMRVRVRHGIRGGRANPTQPNPRNPKRYHRPNNAPHTHTPHSSVVIQSLSLFPPSILLGLGCTPIIIITADETASFIHRSIHRHHHHAFLFFLRAGELRGVLMPIALRYTKVSSL